MSQPTDSTAANGTTVCNSALEEYRAKSAAGYFKPATTDALPYSPYANVLVPNVPAPQVPHPQAPQITLAPSPPPPTTTTYSPYGSLPSTPTPAPRVTFSGHLPNLLPHHNPTQSYGPFHGYQPPPIQRQQDIIVPTPDSITYEDIHARLQFLLGSSLPSWISPHVVLISTALTDQIIDLGKKGQLGPDGIESVNEIFMVVGHEYHGRNGQYHYMALAVTAPIKLKVLLRGPAFFLDGRNPLKDDPSMEMLRDGFKSAAAEEWKRASATYARGVRR